MASSLEELLAAEGFKGRRSGTRSRASFQAEAASMPLYSFRNQRKTDSPSVHSGSSGSRIKTGRTKSDVALYMLRREMPRSDGGRGPRDNLVRRERVDERLKKEIGERYERSGSSDMQEARIFSVNSRGDISGNEIVEADVEENECVKYTYSNDFYNSERSEKSSKEFGEKERHKERLGKDVRVDMRHSNNSNKKHMNVSDTSGKSMKHHDNSYDSFVRDSLKGKIIETDQNQELGNIVPVVSKPALDEVAVQAVVSILSGYIKRFLKEEDFRVMIRQSCFSSLNFIELKEVQSTESKVIANLEQAIKVVEKAAEESVTAKDLKKASLQLSVIASLNSNELKDGFTSGVPNSRLSACAHLYLSVIYKLQKKDKVSAKHILKVFCVSPFQARTVLLPELWDYLFFPHLSHLKVWYNLEADSLANAPSKPRKLKLLKKVFNEILDSGTYQFAVYYKDWLTDGVEAPSIPYIHVPSLSVRGIQQGGSLVHSSELSSPADPSSPKPMVSKKLHDAVFGRSRKPGVGEAEDDRVADNFGDCMRSINGSTVEVNQTLTCSTEIVKHLDQEIEESPHKSAEDDAFLPDDGHLLTSKQELTLLEVNVSPEGDLNNKVSTSNSWQETTGEKYMLHAHPHTKTNELALKMLAKSVFELQQTDVSNDLTISTPSLPTEPIKGKPSYEELHSPSAALHGMYECFDEGSFLASPPRDFICPLTGQLFENPVTLETGQTFEQAAIREWFDHGNRTCPVTLKTLECPKVPLTNFILKRVIDSWKLEHCNRLLAFASQIVGSAGGCESKQRDGTGTFVLEQLLTTFSGDERIANAKHLISLGGLQFLIQRFEVGMLEEKTRVAALLLCCIEADAGCRKQIANQINKRCLLELLHSKHIKSRTNAVLLLTELICLSRRKDVALYLKGLRKEELVNTMHVLLVYLQSSPPEQRPLVAVLLLQLDLLVKPRKYSIYREEAVDAITSALDGSLIDKKVQENCCRALLMLGGHFSTSGKLLTESWILKQSGFNSNGEHSAQEEDSLVDGSISLDDEEQASEEWLKYLSASLLGDGKGSFIETISKCLGFGNLDLVRVCLTTVAWLSCVLSSISDAELQLSAFSALISGLKESLERSEQVEHKVLASISLLNFSRIPECRVLLMTIAEEIAVPLQSLAKVTWAAKQLYTIVSGEDM